MNTLIQELARHHMHVTNSNGYWTEFDYEKFAETILRKCIDICMKNQFTGAENYNNGSVSSAEFIKQHFGLTE